MGRPRLNGEILSLQNKETIYEARYIFNLLPALFSTGAMAQTANAPSPTQPQKADPAAWNMLKSARETSQTIPSNFAGVTFDVVLNDNGKVAKGSINYEAGGSAEVKVEALDEEAKGWLNEQTMSIIAHRRGGDFSKETDAIRSLSPKTTIRPRAGASRSTTR